MLKRQKISNPAIAIAKFYFSRCGRDVSSDSPEFLKTANTIDYLQDSGFSSLDIIKETNKHNGEAIEYDNLSDTLWENSLIKKGTFYLHKELRLESPRPIYNPNTGEVTEFPYYLEMKIRYTEDDVLDYFVKKLKTSLVTSNDRHWDRRVLKEFFKRFSNLDYVEALDVILCSIDRYLDNNPDCYNLRDISVVTGEIVEELTADLQQMQMLDQRKVVARENVI